MRTKGTALLLCVFFGGMGVHRFYLGRTVSALFCLFFCWTFLPLLLAMADVIWILTFSEQEFNKCFNPEMYKLLKTVEAIEQNQPKKSA